MSIGFDPNILASVYKALYNYDNNRKKEAIILLGILIWIYCDIREKEDVAKGVIKRMHNC